MNVIRDWTVAWAAYWRVLTDRTQPASLQRPHHTPGCEVPLVLLPGVLEQWRFDLPIVQAMAAFGHPVHVLPQLGWNTRSLVESAQIVVRYLYARDLRGCVLIAHSKGGLIGKQVLLHPGLDGRALGLVALATPFHGSSSVPAWAVRTNLGELRAFTEEVARLESQTDVNARIVSLSPAWDQLVPEGSFLPGARNRALGIGGHFTPMVDPDIHSLMHDAVHELVRAYEEA